MDTVPMPDRDRILRRMADHSLFRTMLERQGAAPETGAWRGAERQYFEGLRACMGCGAAEACRGWLTQDRPRTEYFQFCPNAPVIEACRKGADVDAFR